MLNKQLQEQIEQEAHKYGGAIPNCAPHIAWRSGAAEYAEKWQAAEAKAERYEKALKEIVNQAAAIASPRGNEIYKIAAEALTPKTSSDECRL